MAKTKSPTPQELYRQRKQREEEEREALLPPGLWNHGNTCFMNSVLQGLIATRFLSELAHFEPLSPQFIDHSRGSQLVPMSRRSPLLTNGYGQAGQHEQDWVDMMPIGDVFIQLMLRAWKSQNQRKRESLSPKPLLNVLGRKYDQYLDFAQQDAHEFLRILLDAGRMEELDVIKKRQPPPEKQRKRRKTSIKQNSDKPPTVNGGPSSQSPLPPIPDDERLVSLADMVFGGKLTSILVCQKCKHISQTFEDFNDISLSIQPEDYQKRKRDRLKKLAKKLAAFPLPSSTSSNSSSADAPRPSSVPPSPKERDLKQQGGLKDPPITEPRRKSLDVVGDPLPESNMTPSKEDLSTTEEAEDLSALPSDIVIVEKPDISPPGKEKGKDNWSKLGKRLSASIGLAKAWKESDKDKNASRQSTRTSAESSRPPISSPSPLAPTDSSASSTRKTSLTGSTTLNTGTSDTSSLGPTPSIILSRPASPPPSQSAAPVVPTPTSPKVATTPRMSEPQRSKSPKPPKPSAAELAYLREILADIAPSSSGGNTLSNLLKPPHTHLFHSQSNGSKADSTTAPSSQSLWLSMSHYSGIEECLRMFTSVEILDGENMVGCRRCWKIANGEIPTTQEDDEDEDSDNAEKEREEQDLPQPLPTTRPTLRLSPPAVHIPTSMSTPTVGIYPYQDSDDRRSVSSLPVSSPVIDNSDTDGSSEPDAAMQTVRIVQPLSTSSVGSDSLPPALSTPSRSHDTRPNGHLDHSAPMMSRSVSAPIGEVADLSTPTPATQVTPRLIQVAAHLPRSPNSPLYDNTLHLPQASRHHHQDQETDESSGAESEVSSIATQDSRQPSRTGSMDSTSSKPLPPSLAPTRKSPETSKPKPTIMRPAYKRYLIAVPPPVLVIHLKRFQQITKVPMISFTQFSHGFKKLDDYVSFPEYLDVTPYLAPKKEDFGLGKSGLKEAKRKREKEKCMYRLYAVIVYLGNMLGGHYIAYTALPEPSSPSNGSTHLVNGEKSHPPPRKWAYISDTVVRLTTLEEVLKAKAYICMYERI